MLSRQAARSIRAAGPDISIGTKLGYIDTTGTLVIDAEYDEPKGSDASMFKSGIAEVRKGDETFFINKKGEKVHPQVELARLGEFRRCPARR